MKTAPKFHAGWSQATLVAAAILGNILLAGCSTLRVKAHEITIVKRTEDALIVRLTADREIESLKGSYWAQVVVLRYSVDDNKPVLVREEYDPDVGPFDRPHLALQVISERSSDLGSTTTYWKVPLEERLDLGQAVYEYSLSDGETHNITFELAGAQLGAGSLESNKITITVSPKDK